MEQCYSPYWMWEEYQAGMWRSVYGKERGELLKKAMEFTGNHKLYGSYMLRAVREWTYSMSMNLTNTSINHQAFVGHAACCIAINCPEDITREAWHYLTQEQQDLANKEADKAIELWNSYFKKGIQPCLKLD